MRRIPVRPVDDENSGLIIFLAPDEISYFFRGSAWFEGLIHTSWKPGFEVKSNRIYVRTIKGGAYYATHRSLSEIRRRFGEPLFPIHQSLLINLNALRKAFLRPADPQVGMIAAPGVDYLTVARRHVPPIKGRLMGDAGA